MALFHDALVIQLPSSSRYEMYKNGSEFFDGEGIVEKGVENTINNIGILASVGRKETDKTIIDIMTNVEKNS